MMVVDLMDFDRNNRRDIRSNETLMQSTVILASREYKLVGSAYFGHSHYCTHCSKHPDNIIYENDGMIQDGKDRATFLTSMLHLSISILILKKELHLTPPV